MIHLKKILEQSTEQTDSLENVYNNMNPEQQTNADNAVIAAKKEVDAENKKEGLDWLPAIGIGLLSLSVIGLASKLGLFKGLAWLGQRLKALRGKGGGSATRGSAAAGESTSLWTKTTGLFSKKIRWTANTTKRQEGIRKTFLEPITRAKNKVTKGTPEYQYLSQVEAELSAALSNPQVMNVLENALVKHASKDMFKAFTSLNKISKAKLYTSAEMPALMADFETLLVQLNKEAGETFNKKWAETMFLTSPKSIFSKTGAKYPWTYNNVVRPYVQQMIDRIYTTTAKTPSAIEKGLEQRAKESGIILPGMPGYVRPSRPIRTPRQ